MDRKLRTERGKALYRQRGRTVEPVFGQIKRRLGYDGLLLRGLARVDRRSTLMASGSRSALLATEQPAAACPVQLERGARPRAGLRDQPAAACLDEG